MNNVVSPVAFLESVLTEAELWAMEASRDSDKFVPTGAHWQWKCNDHDLVAIMDPNTDEFLSSGSCDCFTFSLRSKEEFKSSHSAGTLPIFSIHSAEEVPVAVGAHVTRNDPSSVMRRIEKTRQLLGEHAVRDGRCRVCTAHANGGWARFKAPCPTVFLIAESWGWDGPWELNSPA